MPRTVAGCSAEYVFPIWCLCFLFLGLVVGLFAFSLIEFLLSDWLFEIVCYFSLKLSVFPIDVLHHEFMCVEFQKARVFLFLSRPRCSKCSHPFENQLQTLTTEALN